MNLISKCIMLVALAVGLQGCPSSTVPYNPITNNDLTAPVASVKVDASTTSVNQSTGVSTTATVSSQEATARVPGSPQNKAAIVPIASELDITASASDNESGIKELILSVNRTVYYTNSNGSLSPAYMATQELKRVSNTVSNGQVPPVAIAAIHTGIGAERRFVNANGTNVLGTGVVLTYFVEARNFAGQTTYTDTVTVSGGQIQ